MREIKFRAWDGSQWSYLKIGQTWGAWTESVYSDHCRNGRTFYQFTGLKDVKGREIYEGDVIKFDDKNIGFIDCEEWTEFFVHWIGEPDCTDYARDFYRIGRAEVIGNVHENPELL